MIWVWHKAEERPEGNLGSEQASRTRSKGSPPKYDNSDVPGCSAGRDFETAGVADEFVQDADNLLKLWPVVSVLLPAV